MFFRLVDWSDISKGIICNFHGDLHLKIFYIQKKVKSLNFLIGDKIFKADIIFGDAYYDYAKLMHGLLVSHEMVSKINIKIKMGKV